MPRSQGLLPLGPVFHYENEKKSNIPLEIDESSLGQCEGEVGFKMPAASEIFSMLLQKADEIS